MLVNRIAEILILCSLLPVEAPSVTVVIRDDVRTCGTDQLNLRIFFVDRLLKKPVSGKEIRLLCLPLLVSDSHHGKAERLFMTHTGTHAAPEGIRRAVGKLDQIQGILNELPELRRARLHQLIGLILAGKPHIEHRKRLCANHLAEQEVLVKADSQRLIIVGIFRMPSVLPGGSVNGPAVEI